MSETQHVCETRNDVHGRQPVCLVTCSCGVQSEWMPYPEGHCIDDDGPANRWIERHLRNVGAA